MPPSPLPQAAAAGPDTGVGGSPQPPFPTPNPEPSPMVQATRAVAVAALLALVALGLAWELWLAPTGHRTLAVKVLPLLLPLAGLLKLRLYTYRWLSLFIWLYVIEGLVRANGPQPAPTSALAWAEVALATVLFATCTLHIRWRLKVRKLET